MNKIKFSVLMSVYYKENSIFLDEALKSIIVNQTLVPDEVVLVEDGPLNKSLDDVVEKYVNLYSNIMKVIKLPKNEGLGKALNEGVKFCTYELIARMDSDDISTKFRFEKQISFFNENPEISVVGAFISEFYEDPTFANFTRITPQDNKDIKFMLKRRNPMNHVTVMFKKSDLQKVGGYKHLPFLEDYYLWARFIGNDFKLHNIEEVLVLVRTGESMYRRRSNHEYIYSWRLLQLEMMKLNLVNRFDYFINMFNIVCFIYLPSDIKEYVYKFFLRRRKKFCSHLNKKS